MCNCPRYFPDIKDPFTGRLYPVPCHVCQGCRIDRISMWFNRCSYEYIQQPCCFVTLTYSDYFVKYKKGSLLPTICHEDWSKFVQTLKRRFSAIDPELYRGIRFVACSEYGDKTQRPHFHGILFGIHPSFVDVVKSSWPFGLVDVGAVRKGGIRYVLKYMSKMQVGERNKAEFFDLHREAPHMYFSNGLGSGYFVAHAGEIARYGAIKIGNRFVPVPPYWKNKLFSFTLDNILEVRRRCDEYQNSMDSQARALGFDCYDTYLRTARKVLESVYEQKSLKSGYGHTSFSRFIPDIKLPSDSFIFLDFLKEQPVVDLYNRFMYYD